ncbi:MAG: hypothetical protein HYU05_00585 [Candidatus Wildermuthbacteria bacterium]|nr:hypothetical protein [Candidatus Wildermuthbacteria bacterium]
MSIVPPYQKEQLVKLFYGLPPELKDAMGSLETIDFIDRSCEKNGVHDAKLQNKVADIVGNILLGILFPNDLEQEIKRQTGIDENAAKTLAREIDRFVLYPLKPAFEVLHKEAAHAGTQLPHQEENAIASAPSQKEIVKTEAQKKPARIKQAGTDKYRESIE